MTQADTTTLSVRGEAERTVAPDLAHVDTRVRAVEATKADALRVCGEAHRAVLTELERLGGAALDLAGERRALGWVAHSISTWDEREYRDKVGEFATGRVIAELSMRVTVRDFALMDRIGETFTDHDHLHLVSVDWDVDADNPAWPQVRAEAINAALAKGRDYASALGGSLQRVDHVADSGLLAGFSSGNEQAKRAHALGFARDSGSPSLDPVPQVLNAVIDARFSATVAPLSS